MPASPHPQDRVVLHPSRLQGFLVLLLAIGIGILAMALIKLPLANSGAVHVRLWPQMRSIKVEPWGDLAGNRFDGIQLVPELSSADLDGMRWIISKSDPAKTLKLRASPCFGWFPRLTGACSHPFFGQRLDEMLALLNHHHSRSRALFVTLL